jgi:transcriptional regulator with XRE-family HTH domain
MRGHCDIIFARRLRMFRLQASLTQQHLAGQMTAAGHHMANSAISNIESGRRLVTIGEAVQFAAALGIPLLALVTDGPPHDLSQAQATPWR